MAATEQFQQSLVELEEATLPAQRVSTLIVRGFIQARGGPVGEGGGRRGPAANECMKMPAPGLPCLHAHHGVRCVQELNTVNGLRVHLYTHQQALLALLNLELDRKEAHSLYMDATGGMVGAGAACTLCKVGGHNRSRCGAAYLIYGMCRSASLGLIGVARRSKCTASTLWRRTHGPRSKARRATKGPGSPSWAPWSPQT